MKIKLTTGLVGPRVNHKAGDVIDVPDHQAQRHIDAGEAVLPDELDTACENLKAAKVGQKAAAVNSQVAAQTAATQVVNPATGAKAAPTK